MISRYVHWPVQNWERRTIDYILSPCLFNLYAEYIMRNARLDESQAGTKIARRSINNLRYVDDTTLMAESEEEPKSLLIGVKKESKRAGLKFNIKKTKIMASGPITLWQIGGEAMETVRDYFGGSKITADGDCSQEIKTLAPWKENYDKPRWINHVWSIAYCIFYILRVITVVFRKWFF